ncbi:putative alpha-1,2-mannosidase [Chitinophaga polysaccharea]|uniref:Putative alpha-1,2-mannosidase n=1 Tax=Chitinophaga polysaccharea TaxID=1293035 RepID=A0A561Q5V0_9BACT|nr:glycoside hydrolase domain-containing protein [Chitinophaga polysaccharea]TWF45719.1 putative alpha-1,2-mannosidase [Chitinophaga polysaccharea]
MKKLSLIVGILLMWVGGCQYICAQGVSRYVNLFIGTSGDNGQVDPAACVPYGMVRVCPDSRPRSHSGYDYAVTAISGFSVNRLSGIGCGGNGGNFSIKPAQKDTGLHMLKKTEKAYPGYYAVALNNEVKAAFTATHNIAVERFWYKRGKEAFMTLNVASSFTGVSDVHYDIISEREITGYVKTGTTCDAGTYKLYFHLFTNKPFKVISETKQLVECSFGTADKSPVEVRLAISPISTETAKIENERLRLISFRKIKLRAAVQWEDMLRRIAVSGGNREDRELFYTSLYRVFLSPVNTASYDGQFLATDGTLQKARDAVYYSSWSMWDTYHTKFPLITLLDAARMKDICYSLSLLYLYGKKGWATPFESTPTVRTEHTAVVLLDAYRKGIAGVDLKIPYEGMKKEMEVLEMKRPDQVFETCIDLWAMGNIARETGKTDDALAYETRAARLFNTTWNKEFKIIDSSFTKMRNNGLYQGTRWQYRWALPQYLDTMAASVGGKKVLADQLNYFLTHNLNNQGNEVGIHIPFIFNRLGRPDLLQQVVTQMLTRETKHLYGGNAEYPKPVISKIFKADPAGFLPEMDEDDGAMSGWYVFAAMGIYPLVVGEPVYEISSPLFDHIRVMLADGKYLTIKTVNRHTKDETIKEARFNGKTISNFQLNHCLLVKGGQLELCY